MTDDDIDRLTGYAEDAYSKAINWENVGLAIWTRRVMTALKFIPTLVTIIETLRRQLAVARSTQGGHIETTITNVETRHTCSTCGTVVGSRAS